jgi:23S rRNA pseudouridine2605 synthase
LRRLDAPEGIVVDGWHYEPMKVDIKKKSLETCVLVVSITEGKNREIRRVFSSIGLKV